MRLTVSLCVANTHTPTHPPLLSHTDQHLLCMHTCMVIRVCVHVCAYVCICVYLCIYDRESKTKGVCLCVSVSVYL
jgi:hypothetical protein